MVVRGIENIKIIYLKHLILISILVFSLLSVYTYLTAKESMKDQYQEIAFYIQSSEEKGDIICISSNWVGLTFNYYYKGNLDRHYFSNTQKNIKLMKKIINEYDRLWLVLSNTGVCGNEDINKFIESNYPQFKKIRGVNLIRVKIYLYKICR